MSAYLQSLYGALRTRMAAAWPDVIAHGIYEAEHAELIPWERLSDRLPYAVIAVTGLQASDEWSGMGGQAYVASVDLYRVQAVTGPTGTLLTNLETLRDDLWTHQTALTAGQVLPTPGMALRWDAGLLPNQIFAAKDLLIRAGRISVSVLLGET